MWEYGDTSFIKLNRKILEWEWYSDPNTKALFIHCLLKANWKPGKWHGYEYERGQFITSIPVLAEELNISVQSVRTAINHLKSTGNLTDKSYSKFRIITVLNYDLYQLSNSQTNSQPTDNQQATNRQLTADIRNIKNIKNIKKEIYKERNDVVSNDSVNSLLDDFEKLYAIYPVKQGKAEALKHYKSWLTGKKTPMGKMKLTNKQMWEAIKKYVSTFKDDDYTYMAHFSTFMNNKIIDYLVEEKDE